MPGRTPEELIQQEVIELVCGKVWMDTWGAISPSIPVSRQGNRILHSIQDAVGQITSRVARIEENR